jgi:hypothetical protein
MAVQAGLSKKQDPISKITREKRAGGLAQMANCLPSKHKALNSNPNMTKKKKKKEPRALGTLSGPLYGMTPEKLTFLCPEGKLVGTGR